MLTEVLVVRVPDPKHQDLGAPGRSQCLFLGRRGPNGFYDDVKGGFWQFFFSRVDRLNAKVFAVVGQFFFGAAGQDNFVNPPKPLKFGRRVVLQTRPLTRGPFGTGGWSKGQPRAWHKRLVQRPPPSGNVGWHWVNHLGRRREIFFKAPITGHPNGV